MIARGENLGKVYGWGLTVFIMIF